MQMENASEENFSLVVQIFILYFIVATIFLYSVDIIHGSAVRENRNEIEWK